VKPAGGAEGHTASECGDPLGCHDEMAENEASLLAERDALREALEPLAAWAENERRKHRAANEENEAVYMGELADKARAALGRSGVRDA
jgi:hypothetical protein